MSHLGYFIGLNFVNYIQIDEFDDIDLSIIDKIIDQEKIYELDIEYLSSTKALNFIVLFKNLR
jgi:hypothetical protein